MSGHQISLGMPAAGGMKPARGGVVRLKKFASFAWAPVSFLLLWQLFVEWALIDPLFFPPPLSLLHSGAEMLRSGELAMHVGATLGRTFQGFALGVSAGVSCGIAMGALPAVRHTLDPLISALWASPKLSLLPLLIIAIGIGEAPKILLIALGCFILTALHTVDGVRAIDPAYVELARNYGATPGMLWRKVYLPAVTPAVFTATRLALGRALTLAVSIELINSSRGLGFLVYSAWQGFNMSRLYIAIIIAASLGMTFHGSLRALEKRWISWQ